MNMRLASAAVAGIGLFFALACSGTASTDTFSGIGSTTSGGMTTCPSGASTQDSFADGTRVVLIGLNVDDAYAGSMWEKKIPLAGKVVGDLHNNGGCWFGGGFYGDDGTDFYFYKAAFRAE